MLNWRKPIIYGLLYLRGSKIPAHLREIKKLEKLSSKEIKSYQEEKLKKLLVHAYKNVPYYTKVLSKANVVDKNLNVNLSNWDKIPYLTKDIIRKEFDNLKSKDLNKRKWYYNTSGGSTGEPVKFIQDKFYDEWNTASKMYYSQIWGRDLGEREIKLWGSDRDILKGNLTLKDRIINFLYNRRFYNCYNFSQKEMEGLVKLNNTYHPQSYWAYVDASYEFAKYINLKKRKLQSPKFVTTTIGPLYPEAKKEIEKAFNCKVYNQYGSREMGWLAVQNKEKRLDACYWRALIELKDDFTGSNTKELVVTSLDNYGMPLIRFCIGDVASNGTKKYQEGSLVSHLNIGDVMGRTLGYFKLQDGSLKHTHFLVQQLFFKDWIKQFQIIQEDYDLVICEIVGKRNTAESQMIISNIQRFLGKGFAVKIRMVSKIEKSRSGKHIYTKSKVLEQNAKEKY